MAVRGIELTHEFCCTFVMYLPQAYHQGLSPGIEEAAHQPDQLVSADDHVHPRATAAQGHQFSLQLQLIQVKRLSRELPSRMEENIGLSWRKYTWVAM